MSKLIYQPEVEKITTKVFYEHPKEGEPYFGVPCGKGWYQVDNQTVAERFGMDYNTPAGKQQYLERMRDLATQMQAVVHTDRPMIRIIEISTLVEELSEKIPEQGFYNQLVNQRITNIYDE